MTSPRIPASVVGITAGPREHEIDARWLMAYAAALDEEAPEYFDTARSGGVLAHPLFPVCYEWPLALDVRATALPDEIAVRGVHATHRLTVHRPIRAGERLRTTATVAALERRSPGAYMVLRLETVDAAGRPVTTTDYGSLYLGVACDSSPLSPQGRGQGEGWPKSERNNPPPPGDTWSAEVPISPTLAHVYTECARIWNPIRSPVADRGTRRDCLGQGRVGIAARSDRRARVLLPGLRWGETDAREYIDERGARRARGRPRDLVEPQPGEPGQHRSRGPRAQRVRQARVRHSLTHRGLPKAC